jgi:hypothetical protein
VRSPCFDGGARADPWAVDQAGDGRVGGRGRVAVPGRRKALQWQARVTSRAVPCRCVGCWLWLPADGVVLLRAVRLLRRRPSSTSMLGPYRGLGLGGIRRVPVQRVGATVPSLLSPPPAPARLPQPPSLRWSVRWVARGWGRARAGSGTAAAGPSSPPGRRVRVRRCVRLGVPPAALGSARRVPSPGFGGPGVGGRGGEFQLGRGCSTWGSRREFQPGFRFHPGCVWVQQVGLGDVQAARWGLVR